MLATGFFAAETTEAYMRTTRAHFEAHGRPVAYYSDRYGVFRVNRRDREGEATQFGLGSAKPTRASAEGGVHYRDRHGWRFMLHSG